MIRQAIVIAGGFGTRLKGVVDDVPKPMALINGKPFLAYLFDYLMKQGIHQVVLSVGYKHECISSFFKHQYKKLKIDYSIEQTPLGTGGATKLAFEHIESDAAFVLNGDSIFTINLTNLYSCHLLSKSNVSLALRKINQANRYGTVNIDVNNRITGFTEKGEVAEGFINAGVYVMNKKLFTQNIFPQQFSIEKEYFEKLYKEQPMYGFVFDNYFIDIGVPEDFQKAQNEFKTITY